MGNIFSSDQFNYMYSDNDFLKFLSTIYSTYQVKNQDIDIMLSDDLGIIDMNIYIRIFLANIEDFIFAINDVRKKMSLCNKKEEHEYIGQIKGRLDTGKYVKQIIVKNTPRTYPCIVKKKYYGTLENIFLLFYSYIFCDKLKIIGKYIKLQKIQNQEKSKELEKVSKCIKDITNFISLPELSQFSKQIKKLRKKYGDKLPDIYYDQIMYRLKTNKIVNSSAYTKSIYWIKKFSENKVVFNQSSIKILRYDEEKFCDKLFEIWILYSIKKTLINEYSYKVIEEYGLMEKRIQYTFVLSNDDGEIIKLYFQKGEGVYWTNNIETKWRYIKSDKTSNLIGIPDISIERISSPSKLIMIDAKNKIRTTGKNSDEIYKIIGYMDNFKNRYDNIVYKGDFKKAIIVFRNDSISFTEKLVNDDNDQIITLSVSPTLNIDLNDEQYKIICEEILE